MRGPSVSWHYMFDVLDSLRSTLAPRYDVEREIGAGGMARVYLAVEHHPHRRVAIKVLDPERSEEHTSELQSRLHLVCRLLLEKKKKKKTTIETHISETRT